MPDSRTHRPGDTAAPERPNYSTDDLADLRLLIRVGRTAPTKRKFKPVQTLGERIRELIADLRTGGIEGTDDSNHLLQFAALRAEFEFAFGRHYTGGGVKELTAILDALGLRQQLADWGAHRIKSFGGDEPDFGTLRQRVWALMASAFYGDYASGNVTGAIKTLILLRRVVRDELIPLGDKGYAANGTNARLSEYLAQCFRARRLFGRAHLHLQQAQRFIEARLDEKWNAKHRSVNRDVEQQFAVIATARILAGFGRLALLQGRLRLALQMLRSARTMLIPTGNDVLQTIVESHIEIAKRRLAVPGGRLWTRSMERLETLESIFRGAGDTDGVRRCSYERAQAYLEQAELLPRGRRVKALRDAADCCKSLRGLKKSTREPSAVAIQEYRAHVLEAFAALLALEPNAAAAEASIEKAHAKRMVRETALCHLDLAGCDCVDIRLAIGFVRAVRASQGAGRYEPERFFLELHERARAEDDAELAAEALLRAAWAAFDAGRRDHAAAHLMKWRGYLTVVENAFLLGLFARAVQAIEERPAFEFPLMGFSEDIRQAKQYLLSWALATHNDKVGPAARELRLDPGSLKRMRTRRNGDKPQDGRKDAVRGGRKKQAAKTRVVKKSAAKMPRKRP